MAKGRMTRKGKGKSMPRKSSKGRMKGGGREMSETE